MWLPHVATGPDPENTVVPVDGYHAVGGMQRLLLDSGKLMQRWTYNDRAQVTVLGQFYTPAGVPASPRMKLSLGYGADTSNNGNLASQTIQVGGNLFTATQNYAYDRLNRLTSAQEPVQGGTNWKEAFEYDQWGNRWLDTANTSGLPGAGEETAVAASWYNSSNRVIGWDYDSAGNIKDFNNATSNRQFKYDVENRQVSATVTTPAMSTTYTYDGDGRRVMKVADGVKTVYVYDASGQLAQEYGGSAPTAPGRKYLFTDHLGSTRMTLGGDGIVQGWWDYTSYGQELLGSVGGRSNVAGYPFGGVSQTMKFTGKERDTETGLDYFGARYMSAAQGRFTSPDLPLYAQRPGDPQSWNLYSYTRDNPLRYVDPDGRQDMPPQAECNGNQECIDSVNKTNAQFLTGVGKGVVNGVAATLDFLTCPICRPSDAPLPTEGFAEGAGNVVGSVIGSLGVGKALSMLGEFAFGSSTTASVPAPVLPAYGGGKTVGVLEVGSTRTALTSGVPGPGAGMPKGSPGFDIVTRTHVEWHAAAFMQQNGVANGTLFINNPAICQSCTRLLPRMLAPDKQLTVVLPGGVRVPFRGTPFKQ